MDLIDRQQIVQEAWWLYDDQVGDYYGQVIDLDVVLDAPTVDAQPVVHGRWIESVIERTMGALNGYKCSVCGHEKIGRTCLYNYCPECGAKMDEKVNE